MPVCLLPCCSVHVRWQRAVGLALHNTDPWASRRIHKLPMEVVTRYRYTASTRTWVKDDGECFLVTRQAAYLCICFLLSTSLGLMLLCGLHLMPGHRQYLGSRCSPKQW